MKGEIISLTPAPEWCALIRTGERMTACPLIGWALVRRDGSNHVQGMLVDHAGAVVFAEALSEFLGYAPMWYSEEGVWGEVVRKVIAQKHHIPAAESTLKVVFSGTD